MLQVVYGPGGPGAFRGQLDRGFHGFGQALVEDWVAFGNAGLIKHNVTGRLDYWVLPFLNVFGILGKIDGHAPMDVIVEGNGFLDELGIDCSNPGNVVS